MCALKKEIKKYNKYVIEIEEDELRSSNLDDIENIVIISKNDYETESHKLKGLLAKLESKNLEIELQSLRIQERDLEVQKAISKRKEIEESYAYKLNYIKNEYVNKIEELKHQLETKKSEVERLNSYKDDYGHESEELKQKLETKRSEIEKMKRELEKENQYLSSKLEGEETLKKELEIHKVGNKGLKNDIKTKEEELRKLKLNYENVLQTKTGYEIKIEGYKEELKGFKKIQREHNKLIINYKNLQEESYNKDENIIELESKTEKLENYLSKSGDAINNLKTQGLFNRLLNRVPDGIDELEEQIKEFHIPEEIETDHVEVSEVLEKEKITKPQHLEKSEIEPIRVDKRLDELKAKIKETQTPKKLEIEPVPVNANIHELKENIEKSKSSGKLEKEPNRVNKPGDFLGEKESKYN
ncbi:MAG: hypothetical protein ACXVHM_04605 [Methanobacterium sp.]